MKILWTIVIGGFNRIDLILQGDILIQKMIERFEKTIRVGEQFGKSKVIKMGSILFEVSNIVFFVDGLRL
jgi:hypothetical protein